MENGEFDSYYIWNKAQELFEIMAAAGKEPELVTAYQFGRLARVPGFTKVSAAFKPDVEICFKNMQRKYDC